MYTRRPGRYPGEDSLEARRVRATRLAHERGGMAETAMALASPAPSPWNGTTLSILGKKHPFQDLRDIEAAAVKIGKTSQHHLALEEPRVTEVDRPFDPDDTQQ